MNIINTLDLWQWIVLASVPPAIIALYFLKLKRQPLEVPSTYLWSRTIEDLHVNSIWQRLRQNLLLFLQLLLLVLLMFACCRPGWRGAKLTGDRFIFLIDTSASMSATDVAPSRLEVAKQQVLDLIDQMQSDDVGMVISFADAARIEQAFTNNRSLLRQRVQRIEPTNRTSDLREALRAASGLANPGRSSEATNALDVQVAEALPATLYLYTDGGFAAVPEFSLGNLEPKYVPIGTDAPENVAVVSFTADQNPEKPDQFQAFARLENPGGSAATVEASLHRLDEQGREQMIDAQRIDVPADGSTGVEFSLAQVEQGVLKLTLEHEDHLRLDNVAYAAFRPARPARVLLVTPGNDALRLALSTEGVASLAGITTAAPAELEAKQHRDLAAAGYFDLIVYDRCAPPQMPQANTLFIGRLPPVPGWTQGDKTTAPLVIDTDRVHPLMQYVELGDVNILEGTPLKTPAGGNNLIDGDAGALFAIAPRDGFEDAVLGFEIIGADGKGGSEPKTDWPIRRSFPVFVMNALRYLGMVSEASGSTSVKPGRPVTVRTETPADRITVRTPGGQQVPVARQAEHTFLFANTDQLGVYDVIESRGGKPAQQFAVNLFDSRESDLRPRAEIKLGHEQVRGQGGLEPARQETWKWLVLCGLVVLVFEWYVYNRRVYL